MTDIPIKAALAVMFAASHVASADPINTITGNVLRQACATPDSEAFCAGFIAGFDEGMQSGAFLALVTQDPTASDDELNKRQSASLGYCIPHGVTRNQSQDIVTKFMNEHPEERHKEASYLIWRALLEAFPCPDP